MGWDRGCDVGVIWGGYLGFRGGAEGVMGGMMGLGGPWPLEAELRQQLPRGRCGTPSDPGGGRTSRARAAARAARGSPRQRPAPTCACPAMAAGGPRGSRGVSGGPGRFRGGPGGSAASPARASGTGPAHTGSAAMAGPEAAPRKRLGDPARVRAPGPRG